MSQVKFSIITINCNNKEGLRKTIESVVNQSFKDFEYIIIDGGSTDGSVDVIKEYTSHIDYWVSEPDKGIYNAMNKGIVQAHGEYVNFMNSGDYFCDSAILGWVNAQHVEEDIAIGKVYCLGVNMIKLPPGKNLSMMDLYRNHPPHQAAFIKRTLFENGLFDESFRLVSDWSFFIDRLIFRNCSYRYLDNIIANYDMSGLSTIQTQLLKKEEMMTLGIFFPERILKDYERYKYADSPLLELIPRLNKTYRLNKLVYKLVCYLIKTNDFISNIKRKMRCILEK